MADKAAGKLLPPQTQTHKQPRTRSPNYPAYNLRTVLDDAKRMLDTTGRHAVGVDVALKQMGYSITSSTGKLRLAALRAFGLLDNVESKTAQIVKLSNLALDILADHPDGSPAHVAAIKKAALLPKIHAELFKKYKLPLPPDDEIRRYLVRERVPAFNDKTVGEFIGEYKSTISFAKLAGDDKISEQCADESNEEQRIEIGSYVQWTSQGVDQFPEPRKVVGVSDDGEWAFLEGSQTGVAMKELTPQAPKPSSGQPPPNPHFKSPDGNPTLPTLRPGIVQEVTHLDEGQAVLQLPAELKRESVAEFEYWLEGVIRKARRRAGLSADPKKK